MKECDTFEGAKHTLTPPTYFRGSGLPTPMIYAPGSAYHPAKLRNVRLHVSKLNQKILLCCSAMLIAGICQFSQLGPLPCRQAKNSPTSSSRLRPPPLLRNSVA